MDGIGMLLEHQFGLSGNTPPSAWPEQARRRWIPRFEMGLHELSVIAVCRVGLAGRIATTAIRPW